MVEEIIAPPTPASACARARGLAGASSPRRLNEITSDVEERLPLSMDEFARVLGGGIVPGSIILVGGDPGIGKSTLLLQVALEMAHQCTVLYVSGEELERQIKMRSLRLLRTVEDKKEASLHIPEDLFLVTETNLDAILEHITAVHPVLLIVDFIQTTYLPELEFTAGLGIPGTRVRFPSARAGQIHRDIGLLDRARH